MTRTPTRFMLTLAFSALVIACGPEFAVIPQGGAPQVTATTSGVYLSAFADQWEADPRDLADMVTPIAVDLYNGTNTDIRVSLGDFALRGQDGQRRPALSPFLEPGPYGAGPSSPDQRDDRLALTAGPLLASNGPTLLAWRGGGGHGGWGGGGHGFSLGRGRGVGRGGSWGGWRGGAAGAWGSSHRWGPGFRVSGGLRRFYGPGALYWAGPWGYPLGYSTWVYAWGSTGYIATDNILDEALPEGVLAPGAHVNGFLYFRKATGPEVRAIVLAWTPYDARSGAPIGDAQVTLDVVRR